MKARLIADEKGQWLLFATGDKVPVTKYELQNMLCNFKALFYSLNASDVHAFISPAQVDVYKWNNEHLDITSVPGETLAYITDKSELVIVDVAPFLPLFEDVHCSIEDVETASAYAKRHRKSVEQIKVFCREGRIRGAAKIGRDWVIPKEAPYPLDHRSY